MPHSILVQNHIILDHCLVHGENGHADFRYRWLASDDVLCEMEILLTFRQGAFAEVSSEQGMRAIRDSQLHRKGIRMPASDYRFKSCARQPVSGAVPQFEDVQYCANILPSDKAALAK
jgi:hypothetical protein